MQLFIFNKPCFLIHTAGKDTYDFIDTVCFDTGLVTYKSPTEGLFEIHPSYILK